jgi:hypothetical protein
MAAVTSLVLGGIAAAGAAANIIQGANAKAEANQAASQAAASIAQMQEADKFKSLQVPTLGLQMAQQNVQARQAQQLQGLKDIGASGVLGGLTAINNQAQNEDLAMAAQAQQAQYARDLAQAENAQGVEQRNLARQTGLQQQRLAGAQAASAYGQSQINSGISGLAQTAGNAAIANFAESPLYGQAGQGLNPNGTLTGQQVQKNAQQAFAPQLKTMQPNVKPINVGAQLQQNYMQGLRGAQGQYETMQANNLAGLRANQGLFDNQFQWNPYNSEWNQAPLY